MTKLSQKTLFTIVSILFFTKIFALVDPTRPPNTNNLSVSKRTTTSQPPLQVTGVIKSSQGYKAIINHKSYRLGEKINGLTIAKITANAVFFTDKQTEFKMPVTQHANNGILISKSTRP